MNNPLPKKGIYKHYKQKYYEVLETVRHSETLEELVLYRMLSDSSLWVRPVSMFIEHIEMNGQRVPRFEFISSQTAEEFLLPSAVHTQVLSKCNF